MKELNLKNPTTFSFWRYKKILISLFLGFLSASIVSCADDVETEEELLVIDSAYTTSNEQSSGGGIQPLATSTTAPPVAYPIQIKDEIKIKVGELFAYEDFNWASLFPWNYSISNPEIVAGEGTVCEISEDIFAVIARSPGSCDLRYPSENSGTKGFIFLTVTVTES